MPLIEVLPEQVPDDASDELQALYELGNEGGGRMKMEVRMMGHSPSFARDMMENHRRVIREGLGTLDLKQREAIALAVSSANACINCVKSHRRKCLDAGFTKEQIYEILGITAECSMHNTVWTYRYLVEDDEQRDMPTPLKSELMANASIGTLLVELICIAVSTIRECKLCVKAHTKKAIKAGATPQMLHEANMVAAVMTSYNLYFRLNH